MAVTVVYAGFSLPETLEGVPLILAGQAPSASSLHAHVGLNTIDRRPVAVVVGGGYSDDDYKKLVMLALKLVDRKDRSEQHSSEQITRSPIGSLPKGKVPRKGQMATRQL
jgi:hypothetical protein